MTSRIDGAGIGQRSSSSHSANRRALISLTRVVAWLIAGVVVLRTRVASWWVGACFIGGVCAVIAAQGAYLALEVLWPVGTGLWALGTWGLIASARD